jgi:competence protein ComEC
LLVPYHVWLDPMLLLGAALAGGALCAVLPGPSLFAVAGLLWLLRRRARPVVLGLAVLALGAGAWRARDAIARFESERARARIELGPPQRCAVWGSVETQPIESDGKPRFVVLVARADCETGRIEPGLRVGITGGPDGLSRGDSVEAIVDLAPLEVLHNFDLGDPRPRAARRGVVLTGTALHASIEARGHGLRALIDRARAFVRKRIQASFAPDAIPMARALVLGENDLDPEDDAAFKKSGLSHLLAVSGTHLVFAVASLVRALTALLVRWERFAAGRDAARTASFVGILLALGYADFAGGSGSALRAAFMLGALFAARVVGRSGCASRALAWSLWIGWALDPLVAFDISFLLSLGATCGLLLLGKPFAAPVERLKSRGARFLGASIATTLAAMVPCAPLLALLGSDLTLAGIVANVLAAPLGEVVALPLCLSHALVSPWPELEHGVALVASGALLVVKQIARESAAATFLSIPMPEPNGYQLALVFVAAAALCLGREGAAGRVAPHVRHAWVASALLGVFALELVIRRAGAPKGELRLTALSVGQGDSSLVDLPNGALMLVDAGGVMAGADPGERVVVPALRARRRKYIDVVVLTHPHPDHFGGLLAVVRAVEIGEIWDTGHASERAAGPVYAAFRAEAARRGIPIRFPHELCAGPRDFGGARVRVLEPCPGPVPGRSANDDSFVLELRFGRRGFLMMGDAEHEAEAQLLRDHPEALRADVLKVGHHGSRTSTGSELAERVLPQLATVSCGARNRFGHPSPEVMARLAALGTRALRTDLSGAIRARTDGARLDVEVSSFPALPERLSFLARDPDR